MSKNIEETVEREETPQAVTEESKVTSPSEKKEAIVKVKKGKKQTRPHAHCTVLATFNNTIVTIINTSGETISWGSAGCAGIKGSRKSTPFAAQLASERAAQKAIEVGVKKVDVRVKGAGLGRESAIRSLKISGLEVLSIKDMTGFPHNGCRPKKKRRI